ncbi:Zn-ribbon domain-containing OB-fold protein [Martelella soudanensis]|uniref:Zn-ribbon domain-containing OB-fold protein n=1 Tax=unclassified Martelella TaxID=2629616 RepID=UPI0015DDCE4C|nr:MULTISPECIES: hypothetical protein [unclassified Martelella]
MSTATPSLPSELHRQYHVDAAGRVWLRAGRCTGEGGIVFPPRRFCGDLSEPDEQLLPSDGKVNCITRVRVRAPYGLPQGYMIGFVDFDAAPLRIFGLFDPETADDIAPGSPVRLILKPLGVNNDGAPCLRPVFVAA